MSPRGDMTRRQFAGFAAAAAGFGFARPASVLGQVAEPLPLRSEFLMELEADTAAAQDLGARRIVNVTGGTFEGPRLSGIVLPGGADWITRRPDGASHLDVRITLRTSDEQLIAMQYRGVLHRPDGGELYWRTTPIFETASERYGWLNNVVAVGIGRSLPGKAAYSIYRIL